MIGHPIPPFQTSTVAVTLLPLFTRDAVAPAHRQTPCPNFDL